LEKCAGKEREKERAENKIKIVRVLARHQGVEGETIREKLRFLTQHIEKHINKNEWQDEYIKVFFCFLKQGQLTDEAWGLFVEESSEKIIRQIEAVGTKLKEYWSIDQGVVPSPLRLTKNKLEELPNEVIQKYDLKIGDGVFVLTKKELDALLLTTKEYEIVKPYYKNSDISKYITSEETNDYLIYTTSTTKIDYYPNIKEHLEKFRSILDLRLTRYKESYSWFELHRSREQRIFEGEKIVCSYRVEEASFAYHEGSFYGSTDMYFIKPKDNNDRHSLKYLVAILNSKLIDFWLSKKGKSKGSITEQFATPLENLYIRRIDFNNPEDVKIYDHLVKLVDKIIESKRELAKLDKFSPTAHLIHLPENASLPDVNPESIAKQLTLERQFSLRTHPDIKIAYPQDYEEIKFVLDKVGKIDLTLKGPELKLISKDRKTIFIEGEEELLCIISSILENHKGKSWIAIKEMPFIPESAKDYENKKQEVIEQVTTLRAEIEKLQASIDDMVFKLYGITENPGEINK
jgi:transposase-like protein